MLHYLNEALKLLRVDVKSFIQGIGGIFPYLSEKRRYTKQENIEAWPIFYYPMLFDKKSSSATLGEYFWQDLLVAKKIIALNPKRHIDVGSRIDGFIAHLACVRQVEVFDIRPLQDDIANVHFRQLDITQSNTEYSNVADCVSCLHTLEHIGLGRFGDNIDPNGWKSGLEAVINIAHAGGIIWLSVPIGRQRVLFNSHRIFNPSVFISECEKHGIALKEFHYYKNSTINQSENIPIDVEKLSSEDYSLGVFCFEKLV